MSHGMEILVLEFGEVDDFDWLKNQEEAINKYLNLFRTYPSGHIDGSVKIHNIGKGADWLVVVLVIGGLFFAIPEAHKKVRESLEEWQRIFSEIKSISSWLFEKKHVFYPDSYLFLIALFHVGGRAEADNFIFLGFARMPEENPDLAGREALLFSFYCGSDVYQVAVGRDGAVLWDNVLSIPEAGQ